MQNIYFLYGNDLILIKERIKQIEQDILKLQGVGTDSLNTQKCEFINLEDIEVFFNTSFSLPLFPETTIFQVSLNAKCFQAINKDADEVKNFIQQVSCYKTIVIVLSFDKFNKTIREQIKNSLLLKNFGNKVHVEEFVKFNFWQINEIKTQIIEQSSKLGLRFEEDALNYFVDCIKNDASFLHQELLKIQTYVLPDNNVSLRSIMDLYSVHASMDDLFELIIASDFKSIFNLINKLLKSYNFLYLIAALQNKFRQSFQIKVLMESNLNAFQIAKTIGGNSYRIEKEVARLKSTPSSFLRNLTSALSEIEYKAKTGILNNELALDMLLVKSCLL